MGGKVTATWSSTCPGSLYVWDSATDKNPRKQRRVGRVR
jgi:hypothetical protein